jgi:NO-binding membrane sensor protein with MHYT domain/two-component sensor histidine kinase
MMPIVWNEYLIGMSVLISIFGSFSALSHMQSMRANSGKQSLGWMIAGAITLAMAIWSMHFIGMLSFHLPIQMAFDIKLTLLSILPALLTTLFAFYLLQNSNVRFGRITIAGVVMGLGVAAMHYTGMAALKMQPAIVYDTGIVVLSIVIAIVAASGALLIIFAGDKTGLSPLKQQLLGAVIMGLAIAGMHYTGMAGASFAAGSICAVDGKSVEPLLLAFIVTSVVLALFSAGALANLIDRSTALVQLAISETVSRQSLSELHRLYDHIQTIREDERKRIAQDIHDDLGQNLLVLKMDATALYSGTEGTNPNLNQRASLMLNNINATIQSVKLIINNLRPATLELGLLAAVEWQLKQFTRSSGIDCKLMTSEETELDFDKNKSLALFRIFQEALNNVIRHAQATKLKVKLHRDEHGFSMTIKDNGKGIESGDREKPNSFGLIGIKERAHALGAKFAVESTGNGTSLSIFIAMEKNSALEIIRPTISRAPRKTTSSMQ